MGALADHLDGEGKTLADNFCHGCNIPVNAIGAEYAYGSPERYDGISEYQCPECGRREGRWTGNVLQDGEAEPRFGGQP